MIVWVRVNSTPGAKPSIERGIALARQHVAELGDAEGPVHLGVAAAGDVERQPLVRLLDQTQFQRAVARPRLPPREERRQRGVAGGRHRPSLIAGDSRDRLAGDGHDAVAAELPPERVEHRGEDAGLDLAAGQHAHRVQPLNGGRVVGHRSPPCASEPGCWQRGPA